MIVGELVFVNLGEELGAIHRDIIGLDFFGVLLSIKLVC